MLNRVSHWWRRRRQVSAPEHAVPALSRWFDSPAGRLLLERQRADIDRALSYLFGYHLCQLSVCRGLDLTASSRISHTFSMSPSPGATEAAQCEFGRLPLAPETVDVFLLHHALDFSRMPHQLLAEASRATIARGYIVIVGFNPWSITGLWRAVKAGFSRDPRWHRQSLRLGRLDDWFALLDLTLVDVDRGHYWPLGSSGRVESWLRRLRAPWGGYYVVTVRKDVAGMLPLRPAWQKSPLPAMPGRGTASKVRN